MAAALTPRAVQMLQSLAQQRSWPASNHNTLQGRPTIETTLQLLCPSPTADASSHGGARGTDRAPPRAPAPPTPPSAWWPVCSFVLALRESVCSPLDTSEKLSAAVTQEKGVSVATAPLDVAVVEGCWDRETLLGELGARCNGGSVAVRWALLVGVSRGNLKWSSFVSGIEGMGVKEGDSGAAGRVVGQNSGEEAGEVRGCQQKAGCRELVQTALTSWGLLSAAAEGGC
eukprot:scaffold83241_cov19-Tisochrysis_lutea.AAC.2